MLLSGTALLFDDPFAFLALGLAVIISLVAGITIHECSHAVSARALGDDTAAMMGRITLNPRSHLDPVGSLLLLIAGFGWGKPVPVNPDHIRGGRLGMAFVAAAGPLSNMVLAALLGVLFQIGILESGSFTRSSLQSLDPAAWIVFIASYCVLLNLVLAAFNLLPIHPLDGGNILAGIMPRSMLPLVQTLQTFGPIVLVIVVMLSLATDISVLSFLFGPIMSLADYLVGS